MRAGCEYWIGTLSFCLSMCVCVCVSMDVKIGFVVCKQPCLIIFASANEWLKQNQKQPTIVSLPRCNLQCCSGAYDLSCHGFWTRFTILVMDSLLGSRLIKSGMLNTPNYSGVSLFRLFFTIVNMYCNQLFGIIP